MNKQAKLTKPVADLSERDFTDWLCALPLAAAGPSAQEDFSAAVARARADVAAGRTYPHALVGEWLKTSGDADFKPFKEWFAQTHG